MPDTTTTMQDFENQHKTYKEAYDNGNTLITDDEFDAFEDMGKHLYPTSKVFNIVGMESGVKVKHKVPMMSLDKYRDILKLIQWLNNRQALLTYKLDGCASAIKYNNKNFISGATRGNGLFGQDITRALTFANFPHQILDIGEIEVRGELVISKENFKKLNETLKARGLKQAKSRRNIIPGLISSARKADFDLSKYVHFVAYDILGDYLFETEQEKFNYISSLGFETPVFGLLERQANIKDFIDMYKDIKDEKPYLSDGLVITLNNTEHHEMTDKNPKHKVAYKLANEIVSTINRDIELEVSGHGIVCPVGIVDPIELNEATIRRVTFHNFDYIEKHNINIGATIGIARSGDIIPTHMTTYIPNGTYVPPTNCPVCGSILHKDGAFLMCENSDCKARKVGKISKWVKVLDVKGVSDATIESLYDANIIQTTSDLYTMKVEDIEILNGFGKSSAEKIINAIKKASKNVTQDMIIRGANVRNIGKSVSVELIDVYKSVPNMCDIMNYHDLEKISGIGDETATLLLQKKQEFCSFYKEMAQVVKLKEKSIDSDILKGKSFCITGTLSLSRDEFKEMIEKNGGKVRSSVSSKLDFLLAGDNAGSKLTKANDLEIPILTETDLELLISS